MLNPQRNANLQKRKFEMGIVTTTLFLCVVGLFGMSLMSFFQTQSAFIPLNDPTMVFEGIEFGSTIAFLCALIFQYGQNAALYVKNHYTSGKVIINLFGMFNIKDTTLCWIAFWICAGIDAGTNCLWLYNQPDIRKQNPIFQSIEYAAMIGIVFVEEVLGIVLQSFMHSFTLWKQVSISDKNETGRKVNNNDGNNRYINPSQQPQRNDSKYQPKNKPNQNSTKSLNEPTYRNLMSSRPVVAVNNSKKSKINNFLNDKNESMPSWMKDEIREREKLQNPDLYNHGFDEGMEKPNWNEED